MYQVDVITSIERKYRDELDLYSLLHGLCKEQQKAARRGSTAEVLRLGKAKEELMKKINHLELEIESLRASLKLDDLSPGTSGREGSSPGQGTHENVLELNPSQHGGTRGSTPFRNSPAIRNR